MLQVIVDPLQSLDYRSWPKPLAVPLKPVWSVSVGYEVGHTRLRAIGPDLVLVDGQTGWLEVGAGPFEKWTRHAMPLGNIAGGLAGGAVVFDAQGHIYRYQWGSAPQQVWAAEVPATNLIVTGLDAHRLLVQTCRAGTWQMQAVDTQSRRVLWSHPGMAALVLPFAGGVVLEPAEALHTLRCLDIETGRVRWQASDLAGMTNLIGIVGQRLWVGATPSTLYSLRLADGTRAETVQVSQHRVPQGILDQQGRLHLLNGVQYHVVDLADQGRRVRGTALDWQGLGPSGALGRLALYTTDDHLIFNDDQGRVMQIHPAHPGRLEPLYIGEVPVASIGVAHGRLLMLDRQGTLHIWGH